jgi:two-component system, chemotaxis family, chemotaxis protein CheY
MSSHITIQDLSVLLVEPSDVQNKLIIRALNEAGIHKIENSPNVKQTLSILEDYTPDLIVSSMYLEDGTADELLQLIRHSPDHENQAFMLFLVNRIKPTLKD